MTLHHKGHDGTGSTSATLPDIFCGRRRAQAELLREQLSAISEQESRRRVEEEREREREREVLVASARKEREAAHVAALAAFIDAERAVRETRLCRNCNCGRHAHFC